MTLDHAWEQFCAAVMTLASGTGTIQQRLCDAYRGSLVHLDRPDDLPVQLRPDFEAIRQSLTSAKPAGDEGPVAASANALSDPEAVAIAKQVVGLFDEIARLQGLAAGR